MAQIHASNAAWAEVRRAASRYLGTPGQSAADNASASLLLGIAHARLDAPQEAIDTLRPITESRVSDDVAAQSRLELARAHLTLGDDRQAELAAATLLDAQPDSRFAPHALRLLASLAADSGDTERADAMYAQAAASGDADFAEAIAVERAGVLFAAGRDAQAADVLQPFESAAARGWRVVALGRAGRHDEALGAAEGLDDAQLGDDLAGQYAFHLAESARQSGDFERSRDLLLPLLDSDELAVDASLRLAELAIEEGDHTASAEMLDGALAQLPTDRPELCAIVRYQLAWCRHQLGDARGVIEALDEAPCELAPVAAPAALLLGEALDSVGRHTDAAERFAAALEHDLDADDREAALLRLGEAAAAAQDWRASLEAFETHRGEFAESPRWFAAAFGAGWAKENLDRPEAAIEHYREVVRGHDGETVARAQFQIGECLFALGRHDEAVREFLRVDTLYDQPRWSAAALFEAGRCFESLNKIGEARSQYRRVLENHQDSAWADAAAERLRAIAAPGG